MSKENKDKNQNYSDNPIEVNGGEIQGSRVIPEKVDVYLNTYYPGRYPYYIGHSSLRAGTSWPIVIDSTMDDKDYNLFINNCADHTGRFLKYVLKRDFKPYFFTTPGDVRDFIKQDTIDSKSPHNGVYQQHIQVPFLDYQLARNKYMTEIYGDKFKPYIVHPFRTTPTSRNYANWDEGYRLNRDGSVYNIYQDNPDIDMFERDSVWANGLARWNMRKEGWRENSGKWYPEEEYNTLFYLSGGNLPLIAKSGIHIKKKNRGKFTDSAKEHGMGVQEYATKVLNDPNATPLQKRRANFARNSSHWKH